jgi:hypothetical protein
MWHGHEFSLAYYGLTICLEWRSRGYKDTMLDRFLAAVANLPAAPDPSWLGHEAFHLSHQSNLVRKMPQHYGPLFPGVPNDLPYIWPTPSRART